MDERRGKGGREERAFTLIELLIVVAIIAILAAIAVPNFMEAQTRSKVSRAKADMRSMTTAVEAYSVDHNSPPPGAHSLDNACVCVGGRKENNNARGQALLTTPIAYITDILKDPFRATGVINQRTKKPGQDLGARLFAYEDYRIPSDHATYNATNRSFQKCFLMGYTWSFRSVGPLRNHEGNIMRLLRGEYFTDSYSTAVVYDPSNGTMSMGWIVRTNKGICTGPGS